MTAHIGGKNLTNSRKTCFTLTFGTERIGRAPGGAEYGGSSTGETDRQMPAMQLKEETVSGRSARGAGSHDGAGEHVHASGAGPGENVHVRAAGPIERVHVRGAEPIENGHGQRVRLILADPDPLARRMIRESVGEHQDMVVVAEAKDGVELVELAGHYKPELVLTELGLPSLDGIDACRKIRAKTPSIQVIVFTVSQDREMEVRALRAGASGVLSKDINIDSVIRAARAVLDGEAAISRRLTMHLIELMRRTSETGTGLRPVKSVLTSREWEVLDLICTGASTREIAEILFLSEDTVYSHSKSILRKLGVHSRSEAARVAERLRSATAV